MYEKNVNIINVNGKEFWVDDEHTFEPVLEALGLTKEDVFGYMYDFLLDRAKEEAYKEASAAGVCNSLLYGDAFDGVVGESWFKYREALKSEIDDLQNDIYESLLSPSRKNNTKADIARRLKNIIDNLYDIY